MYKIEMADKSQILEAEISAFLKVEIWWEKEWWILDML